MSIKQPDGNWGKLHARLLHYFDVEELRDLCFHLGVEYDDLRGEGRKGKARELLKFCARDGKIEELLTAIQERRPQVDWPKASEFPQTAVWQERKVEREIVADHRQEDTLRKYLDQLQGLLLEKGLRDSEKDAAVRSVARARTLQALERLDGTRKGMLVRFLYEPGQYRPDKE